jgi:hypothetical protein
MEKYIAIWSRLVSFAILRAVTMKGITLLTCDAVYSKFTDVLKQQAASNSYPEDGSSTFLQNIDQHLPECTAPFSRTQQSSWSRPHFETRFLLS